jgi:hypothetical protein
MTDQPDLPDERPEPKRSKPRRLRDLDRQEQQEFAQGIRDAVAPLAGSALRINADQLAQIAALGDRDVAFGRIAEFAQQNARVMDGLATVKRVPSVQEVALTEMRSDIAELVEVAGSQATNVALQAELARRQGQQLDELISAIKAASRTAERLELAAILLAIVVAIPVIAGILDWFGTVAVPWLQTTFLAVGHSV